MVHIEDFIFNTIKMMKNTDVQTITKHMGMSIGDETGAVS